MAILCIFIHNLHCFSNYWAWRWWKTQQSWRHRLQTWEGTGWDGFGKQSQQWGCRSCLPYCGRWWKILRVGSSPESTIRSWRRSLLHPWAHSHGHCYHMILGNPNPHPAAPSAPKFTSPTPSHHIIPTLILIAPSTTTIASPSVWSTLHQQELACSSFVTWSSVFFTNWWFIFINHGQSDIYSVICCGHTQIRCSSTNGSEFFPHRRGHARICLAHLY